MVRSNSRDWKMIFRTNLSTLNIGVMKCGRVKWQETEATRKNFNVVLIHQDKIFLSPSSSWSFRTQPYWSSLQDHVLIPNIFFEYSYHVGCAINLHSTTNSGLIPGGQNLSKRQTVFFTSVDPLNEEHRYPNNIDLEAPCLAWYK